MLIVASFCVKPDIHRISLDRFRVLAVIQFAMDTFDAGHCTETLSEFDRMDFVPLGCVKPDFYKGL
jgi:hypothetical protein